MVTRCKRLLWAALAAGFLLSPAPAAAVSDLLGTRAIGMGGALRAVPSGEAGPLLNPAGMSLTRMYVISALYQFRLGDSAHLVNASVVDSATTKVAAGLFYSFSNSKPSYHLPQPGDPYRLEENIQTHQAGLSLSYAFGNWVTIGLTTKYVRHTLDLPADLPEEVDLHEETVNMVTMDAGAIVRPFSSLNLGVVGYNLIPVDGSSFPIKLGVGAAYTFGTRLLLAFDGVMDFKTDDRLTATFGGGGELFLGKMFSLRAGAQHNTLRSTTYVTAGAGLVVKKLGIDAAVRQMVDGGAETLMAFSLRLFLI